MHWVHPLSVQLAREQIMLERTLPALSRSQRERMAEAAARKESRDLWSEHVREQRRYRVGAARLSDDT